MTNTNWLKLIIFINFDPPGCAGASGDLVGRFWSDFEPWGCSGARVMTILVFYVGLLFPNIGYFGVNEGIWVYMDLFDSM